MKYIKNLILFFVLFLASISFADTEIEYSNADSTPANWTSTEGTSHDALLSDDGDTTYIDKQDSQGGEALLHAAFTLTDVASVNSVAYTGEARMASGEATLALRLYVNGTNYTIDTFDLTGTSYGTHVATSLTNPDTSGAWDPDDIKQTGSNQLTGTNIRVTNTLTAGEEIRVTEAFLTCDFEVTGGVVVPVLDHSRRLQMMGQ